MLLTARHMRGQALIMFTGFLASLPLVLLATNTNAPLVVSFGLPGVIFILCITGIVVLRHRFDFVDGTRQAQQAIGSIWRLCLATAIMGSLWCVWSWAAAAPQDKLYFPAIMSLGALTLGYCLTAVRRVAVTTLLITMLPIAVALASTGEPMNLILAGCQMIAVAFQIFLINRHQSLLLEMVEAQAAAVQQARRDPLTGLANRRALMERFTALAERGEHVRLMVVDIDRFKAINDRFGHDMGDEVLRAFAQILSIHARGDICAARLGGEEFALLASCEALDPALALQLLGEIRGAYMPHGAQITASIGVADAFIHETEDWTALYGKADRALYRAKNDGRNRVETFAFDLEDERPAALPLSRSA
ncbi:GGDEF domain-containing protein [Qipengyuania flava]|uniref:GGDEF domain-containing protein n=1 Tax=Qipengyuania flava TaxID=192812 RepID=UPI001C636F61|nr:diguanylate cyclase [Qipengyuania flava]QYJ06251.1 diguanylate cyclase [Qipengyuania flava]